MSSDGSSSPIRFNPKGMQIGTYCSHSPSSSPPPPDLIEAECQDRSDNQDGHRIQVKVQLKKSSGNIASFLRSSKESGFLQELSRKTTPPSHTTDTFTPLLQNQSAPVLSPISEERSRPRTAGYKKIPMLPPRKIKKACSVDQIMAISTTSERELSPDRVSETSSLLEHLGVMEDNSPDCVSQHSNSTSSSHTDISSADGEPANQMYYSPTMKTPSSIDAESSEVYKPVPKGPKLSPAKTGDASNRKLPLPPRPKPVGRSASDSSSEELRQEKSESKSPPDPPPMSRPVPKPRTRLPKSSTVPEFATDKDDVDSPHDQPHSAGCVHHPESQSRLGLGLGKEPVVVELKYENEILKHQIMYLKDQKSELTQENRTLKEEISQLQGSGDFSPPMPRPVPRKGSSPAVQSLESELTQENRTLKEEISQLPSSGDFSPPMPRPVPRKGSSPAVQALAPLPKPPPAYSTRTRAKSSSEASESSDVGSIPSAGSLPPPSPALSSSTVLSPHVPQERNIPKLRSSSVGSDPPDSVCSEATKTTTTATTTATPSTTASEATTAQTTTTQTTTTTKTQESPTQKPRFVHKPGQLGNQVTEDGGSKISPQKHMAPQRPIPAPRTFSRSDSIPERPTEHAGEATVGQSREAPLVEGAVHSAVPSHARLGVMYKTVAIKSDESWIKRKRLDSDDDSDKTRSQPDLTTAQPPRRPNMPYRSHPILPPSTSPTPTPTPSPHTSTSHLPPSLPQSGKIQPPKILSNRRDELAMNSVPDLKRRRAPDPPGRPADTRRHSLPRSNSDDSLSGSLQRGLQISTSMRQADVEWRRQGSSYRVGPPKKPPRPWLKQQKPVVEDPNFRPVSMIENSDSPKMPHREKDFGMSCTVPRGIQPDAKTLQKSPRQKRLQKLSTESGLHVHATPEENGKQKSKGLLGRFKNKTQYAKPDAGVLMMEPTRQVDEEGGEDGSDSSSEDEKGGTIKFMPKLRHVSVKKSFRVSSMDEDSEPEYHQLFEYAFVVGLKEDPKSGKLTTEMKYTFPPVAGMVFTGKDVALEAIPQFCFPDIDRWRPTMKYSSETFSFVLTDIEGSKRFGYCRRLLPAGSGPRLPEVYCIVSPLGCFSLYSKILDHMEERRAVSSSAVFTFLKAISANPFPRPGRSVEIRTFSAKGTGMETVVFTRPMDSRLEHVDFSVLFSTLSCRKIIQLFSSMLMERRIILCAHSLSLLTGCAHALLALCYPFEWQHVFIPVLPTSLIDFVCSPLPYMMGIHPSCIKHLDDLEMEEAVVIDLEKKKFIRKIGDEMSILPSKLFQYLEHALGSSVISSEYLKSPSRRPHPSRADEIVVNTFMTFFVYLYGDYRRHLKTVNPAAGVVEFQKKDFVKSFSSKSIRRFLGAFHLTQMFENFIEQRENPAKAAMAAQSLFDRKKIAELKERCQEIEIFSSKSKFDRWKIRKGLAKKK